MIMQQSRTPKVSAFSRGRRGTRPAFETFENRQLLSTVDWISSTSGSWDVASNWSTDAVPGTGDDVVINVSGIAVTSSVNVSVNSVTSQAELELTGGTFDVANVKATSSLASVVVNSGATLETSAGTTQVSGNGTVAGTVDTAAGATLSITGGTLTVTATNALTDSGLIQLDGGWLAANATQSVQNLEIDYATNFWGSIGGLTGSSNVTVTNNFNWYGSTLGGGGGGLIVAPNATLNILSANAHDLDALTLTNNGTINWPDTGNILSSGGGDIVNAGTFNDQNDHSYEDSGSGGGFTNLATGVYTKSVGLYSQSTEFSLPFNNNGTVNIQQGTLNLNDGGTGSGDFDISAGTVLQFSGGTTNFQSANTLTGPGLVQIDGGTLSATAAQSIQNLEIDYVTDFWGPIGGVTGSGDVTVTGTFNWYGSYVGSGGGGLIVAPGATLNILGTNDHDLDAQTLTNDGTINWSGTGNILSSSGGNIVNAGTFNDENDHSYEDNGSGGGFTNAVGGVYTKSVGLIGQSTEFTLPFANNGTVNIQQGTFNLNDGGADPGDFDTSAGATIEVTGGTLTLNSPDTLIGPGLVQINAGSLTANAVQSIPNLEIDYATDFWGPIGGLFGSADVTVTGTFNWYGSYAGSGGGGLIVAPGATLNILGANPHNLDAQTLTNDGTINWTGSGSISLTDGGTIVNAGAFNVDDNGSFSADGSGAGITGDGGTFNVAQGRNPRPDRWADRDLCGHVQRFRRRHGDAEQRHARHRHRRCHLRLPRQHVPVDRRRDQRRLGRSDQCRNDQPLRTQREANLR